MTLEEIEALIQEGLNVQLMAWPSPMTPLKNAIKSRAQPEFHRTLEDDWLYFNSDAAKDKFYKNNLRATTKQHELALLVMDWMNIAARRWRYGKPKGVIKAIIALRCLHRGDASYGWRSIAVELSRMDVKMSHCTVKNYYNRAMEELLSKLNKQ